MNGRLLIPALVLAVTLAATPLPISEEGEVIIGPGETWTHTMDLPSSARVTLIMSSDVPVDVILLDQRPASDGTPRDIVLPGSENKVSEAHWTERLSPGAYQLVFRNDSPDPVEVNYQVLRDYQVVGDLTAKNLMALSLSLAVLAVAAFLFWLRRGHFQ